MHTPSKPRPFNVRKLQDLPAQYEDTPAYLVSRKKIQDGNIHNLQDLAKKYKYISFDIYNEAIIFGNTIKPAVKKESAYYLKVKQLNDEIEADNKAGLEKYEQAMIKYRKYVDKYRAWIAEQKLLGNI